MKLNLSITSAQVPVARGPLIGEEVEVYFAPENCTLLGTLRATAAAVGEYTSAGGLGIAATGRELVLRAASSNLTGVAGSAMTATFNVTVEGSVVDTAVATFHIPTWSASSLNKFPIGIAVDVIPVTNPTLKILTITSLASVTNMVAGNKFELFSTPASTDFQFIECTRGKGGMLNLPGIVEIPCGRNPSAFTKLGRGESNKLKIAFANRGALEQLARFNGHQGTIRFDIIKDDSVLAERRLFTDFYVRANGDMPDTGAVEYEAEGPYTSFFLGYPRVA
jgi:hypothetical protein